MLGNSHVGPLRLPLLHQRSIYLLIIIIIPRASVGCLRSLWAVWFNRSICCCSTKRRIYRPPPGVFRTLPCTILAGGALYASSNVFTFLVRCLFGGLIPSPLSQEVLRSNSISQSKVGALPSCWRELADQGPTSSQ